MPLPVPRPGLVISYSYLWADQARAGDGEGRKDRPCVVVVAVVDREGDTLVYVAPVTHSRPMGDEAIALPPPVKRHLNLDAEAS